MEQLMATPVKTLELFMGKLIPYFLIGFADVLLCVVTGTLLFQVPLRGSLPLLFFLSSIFLFVALGQGFLISVVTKNQLLASQVALVSTFLPAFLLSGFMFSIKNMPILLQGITYLIPARYFVTILQGIFLKGIGLTLLWVDMLVLAFAVLLLSTLAHKRFSKKLL
jgi:ABC-2 type transport system permease protein